MLSFQRDILSQLTGGPDALVIMARGLGLRSVVTTFVSLSVRSVECHSEGCGSPRGADRGRTLPCTAQGLRHAREARVPTQRDGRRGARARRGSGHENEDCRVRLARSHQVRPAVSCHEHRLIPSLLSRETLTCPPRFFTGRECTRTEGCSRSRRRSSLPTCSKAACQSTSSPG